MKVLREYIRELLREDAEDSLKMSSVDNLALVIDGARHATTFILYDPFYYAEQMKTAIAKAYEEFNKIKLKGDFDFRNFYSFSNVQDVFVDVNGIYGFLNVNMGRMIGIKGGCFDANEIRSVAARKGYGIIMYLVAMSVESPVMPNRDKVSQQAKDFWEYFNTERDKIEVDRFSDEDLLHKKTEKDCKVHGDKVLDQAYSLKKSIKLQELVLRHKRFLEQMKKYFEDHEVDFVKTRVTEYISSAGKLFFETTQYRDE